MRRVLFQWHGIEIFSYPAMLYLGLLFGIVVGNFAAHIVNLNSAHVFVATLLLLIPALVGARLLFVVSHWDYYRREPKRIWRQSEGGGAMYGGLPVALLVSLPLLQILRLPFGAFWDVATFTILVGMIFTRIGCLLNGCCAGRATEGRLALYLPDHQGIWQRRMPTQLLEAAWAIVLLIGALGIWHQMPFRGALFLSALAGYGAGRCKCYDESEPLADPKMSHWPQQSAILERNFERAEGKKGVSRGTSRRNSHLGLDPGQEPARSSPALWALAQHRCQASPGGASSERP